MRLMTLEKCPGRAYSPLLCQMSLGASSREKAVCPFSVQIKPRRVYLTPIIDSIKICANFLLPGLLLFRPASRKALATKLSSFTLLQLGAQRMLGPALEVCSVSLIA